MKKAKSLRYKVKESFCRGKISIFPAVVDVIIFPIWVELQ